MLRWKVSLQRRPPQPTYCILLHFLGKCRSLKLSIQYILGTDCIAMESSTVWAASSTVCSCTMQEGPQHSWNAVVDKSNKYNVVKSIERIFHVLPCWKPCIVLCERIKIRPSFFSHEKRPRAPTKNPHALQRRSFFNNNNIKLPGRKPPGQGTLALSNPRFAFLYLFFPALDGVYMF